MPPWFEGRRLTETFLYGYIRSTIYLKENICLRHSLTSNWLHIVFVFCTHINTCMCFVWCGHNGPLISYSGMLKQMEEDKCRFGAAAWASAAPRLEKLRFLLAKETLQHMRATEMCLNRKKNGIRQRVCVCVSHIFKININHSISSGSAISQHIP